RRASQHQRAPCRAERSPPCQVPYLCFSQRAPPTTAAAMRPPPSSEKPLLAAGSGTGTGVGVGSGFGVTGPGTGPTGFGFGFGVGITIDGQAPPPRGPQDAIHIEPV